jgi:hypothetical protein
MGRAGGSDPPLLAVEDDDEDNADDEPGADELPAASELETSDVEPGALVAELDVDPVLLLLPALLLLLLPLPEARDVLPVVEVPLDAALEEGGRNDTAPLDDDALVEESTWVDVQAAKLNRVIHRQARFMGAHPGGVRVTAPASTTRQLG